MIARTARVSAAIAVATVLVAGCGGDPTPTVEPGADGPATDEPVAGTPVELPECADWDEERVYTPPAEEQPPTDPDITSPELFRDIEPFDDGGSGMGGFGAAREWAEREASEHFAGLWIDNHHNAAVIAFTDDVDRYAEEVRDRFGAGWWVVEAEHSYAELERVQAGIDLSPDGGVAEGDLDGEEPSPRTPPGAVVGTALLESQQQVEVTVVGGDDEVLAALAERYDHPAVCFSVLPPPPSYDEDGPVRTLATVTGWREGLERDHPGFALLEIADDREAAERAFTDNVPDDLPAVDGDPSEDGLHAGLDTVDWDRETVVVFSAGRSGSCPVWIEDVRVDDGSVSVTEATPTRGGCTDDYNPFRAVLAVDRDRLPAVDELPLPVNEGFPEGSEAVVYPTG